MEDFLVFAFIVIVVVLINGGVSVKIGDIIIGNRNRKDK